MRLTILTTVVLFLSSFHASKDLPTIEIASIDKDILTRVRLDCTVFADNYADERKRKTTIKGQARINKFLNELRTLERFEDKTDTDTRAQITIKYQDGKIDKICADRFSICQNGTCYKMTSRLERLIW